MDTQRIRTILYIIAIFLVVMLYMKWEMLHAPKPTAQPVSTQVQSTTTTDTDSAASASQVPSFAQEKQPLATDHNALPESTSQTVQSHYITVQTHTLRLKIDLNGGEITEAQLMQYPEALGSTTPFTLLRNQESEKYLAQSGFVSSQMTTPVSKFQAAKTHYDIGQAAHMQVVLTAQQKNGIKISKTFSLSANSYTVGVSEKITNESDTAITGRFYGQLLRHMPQEKHHSLLEGYSTYTGAAVSSDANHYQKVSFKNMAAQNLNLTTTGGWAAMVQHYFISAWVPTAQQKNQLYSRVYNDTYGIGIAYPETQIAPGKSYEANAKLYVGPAVTDTLDALAPYLGKTVDYGWLWFISEIIFVVMSWIYGIIGNWGWSIILVTILIKLIFMPLSAKSYRSMAKMRRLAPRIKQLKERCSDDKKSLGKATMELYRKEKVNPLGGCLPMVIQIPVFFALYWVLIESVQLRQAPFIFWIHDLSVRDPYFIMPIVMGLSMFVQQKLNPAPADPTQAKVMMLLPIIFTVMFAFFPAGLVLYWLVNNLVSISQQWWIMRRVDQQAAMKKP